MKNKKCVDCETKEAKFVVLRPDLFEIPLCGSCFADFSDVFEDQFCYVGISNLVKQAAPDNI